MSAPPRTLLERCHAYAAKLPSDQWFSHQTAARLWGLPLPRAFETDDVLHISSPGREPHGRGVVGHRRTAHRDIRLLDGLPLSSPCEAWCELAGVLDRDALIEAGDRLLAWRNPLATEPELVEAMRRWAGRRGARVLRAAWLEIQPGSASARETWSRLLALRAGLPKPELNGPVELRSGITHGDLVFREYRVILEYDGEQHRTSSSQWARDVDRLNELALAGWLVVRVTRRSTPSAVLALLEEALRSRGWSPV